jgi:hypothetical protein
MHQTLRCTPAMEAKVTDRVWELSDVIGLLDQSEQRLLNTPSLGISPKKTRNGPGTVRY